MRVGCGEVFYVVYLDTLLSAFVAEGKCNKDSSFEMQLNATAVTNKPSVTQLVKLRTGHSHVQVYVRVRVHLHVHVHIQEALSEWLQVSSATSVPRGRTATGRNTKLAHVGFIILL